eukprot:9616336-Lingulodinium_polyedra.AAC.1
MSCHSSSTQTRPLVPRITTKSSSARAASGTTAPKPLEAASASLQRPSAFTSSASSTGKPRSTAKSRGAR